MLALAIASLSAPVYAVNGSFELGESGKVDVRAYGSFEMRGKYELDADIGNAEAGYPSAVPVENTDRDEGQGDTDFSIATSKLGLIADHESGWRVRVEADFMGEDDLSFVAQRDGGVRIRHAYAEYDNWLVGQTWTLTRSMVGRINTVDWEGGTGFGIEERMPQIRYTAGPFAVALEDTNPYADVAVATYDQNFMTGEMEAWLNEEPNASNSTQTDIKRDLPALTAAFEDDLAAGVRARLAGVVARTSSETRTCAVQGDCLLPDAPKASDSIVGYGVFAGSDLAITDTVNLHVTAHYADGAASYVNNTGQGNLGAFATMDAILDTRTGQLHAVESLGGSIGATWAIGPGTLGAMYSVAQNDLDSIEAFNDSTSADRALEKAEIAFLNYFWQPGEDVTAGVEYAHYRVKTHGGDRGEAGRVNAKLAFNF